MTDKAIVLLSGGLDSATVLAVAQREGFDCYALSFNYGQRHAAELTCAARTAARAQVPHAVLQLHMFGVSALLPDDSSPSGRSPAVPKGGFPTEGIPVTYVPARNTVFLAHALALAEAIDARDIFLGVNAVDYSGYPDCRPEYLKAFSAMANLATKQAVEGHGVTIHAPLIALTKVAIIRLGRSLGVDYAMTSSCYDPTAAGACGQCDSCTIRLRGFAELGASDPIEYRA